MKRTRLMYAAYIIFGIAGTAMLPCFLWFGDAPFPETPVKVAVVTVASLYGGGVAVWIWHQVQAFARQAR